MKLWYYLAYSRCFIKLQMFQMNQKRWEMDKWLEMTSILDHKLRTEITFRDIVFSWYMGAFFFASFGVWISWWFLHVEMDVSWYLLCCSLASVHQNPCSCSPQSCVDVHSLKTSSPSFWFSLNCFLLGSVHLWATRLHTWAHIIFRHRGWLSFPKSQLQKSEYVSM